MANFNIPVPNYPSVYGPSKVNLVDHVGPANYVTGGESILPSWFGFPAYIETVGSEFSGNSFSTNYYVRIVPPANSFNANELYASTWGANASNANNVNSLQLLWYYSANNNQVAANTNLSAEGVRLRAYGG